ncbi:MAG TPA: serine/threonine-protein kinase [Polyangiaceae bacterium]|nr:serine/threonine-protein kinase [Polyangiaceae bacterium]
MTAGTILAGKYRLVSLLGRGGMGSVWRAERMGWQSPVAIKLMNAVDVHDSPALARFQREARLAASLRSIHVVQVLDDGVDSATGAPFIVMELLDGESLAERLSRVKRLRPPVVAQIVTQIARALGRAHDAGLIHRDLKPDNILIVRNDDEEIVKVLDFGIAKWMAGPQNLAGGTLAGQMLGTPAYMSPEHFANSSHIDHRADLWSLGVIAFECLTGSRPFQGDTLVSLALAVCSGKYPLASSLADVPDGFDRWFERAVAQDATHRYPSARVMAEELRGLCGHIPMLWELEATPPVQHATREKTELEPVLELTRRARSSRVPRAPDPRFPITEVDSVLPMLRTPQPAKRHGWRWALAIAFFLGFIGTTVVATPTLRPFTVERVAARLREAAESFRGAPPLELAPAPAAAAASGAAAPGSSGAAAPASHAQPARPLPQKAPVVGSIKREAEGGPDAGRSTDAGDQL